MIKKFIASNFEGVCNVDEDIIPQLKQMNDIAVKYGLTVIVTSSFRKDTNVKGAIVPPAKMSNHLVGQAIDFNLKNKKTGAYYNSTKLGDGIGEDEQFCREVVKVTGLFWGEAFKVKDSVHIDSRLNKTNPVLWQQKYNKIHGI